MYLSNSLKRMQTSMNYNQFTTFYALLCKDITIFNKRWLYRSIDCFIWITSVILVAQYLMPLFGIKDPQYGTFTLLGNLAVWGFFEIHTSIALFLGDIEGDKSISYYLSLPIPAWLVFVEYAFASAYRSILSSLIILPIGKLIIGDHFIISNIHWFQFIIAFIMINIFYGFFTIFIVSFMPDLASLSMVKSRILFPLWFLGGFQFTWHMLYNVAPTVAYINLCNPLIYVMEGIRSTTLPKEMYLPFWNCMGMLILFSILFGYIGIKKLTKRLDCL